MMQWNGKPPVQWEWEENLIMFSGSPSENPNKLREKDLEIVGDKGINFGSLNSSGNGRDNSGGGSSGSDFDIACLSKSSQSASISSSSIGEVKTSKPASKASIRAEDFDHELEFEKTKVISTSPTLDASVQSAEPLLSLKLGKHTYIGVNCAGSNDKTSSFSLTPVPTVTLAKRSKISHKSTQAPRCQVEGCDLDLSSAKDYHRKHRVCESHSRCPQVVVAGIVRRFCQQCSRFHGLSEFDEKKRSCRRRLSDHNARRRKPQSESVNLNPGSLSRSLWDGRQQMNIVLNGAPHIHARCNRDLVLESSPGSKFTILREYPKKPENGGDSDCQLHFVGNSMTTSMPVDHHDANSLIPYKVKSPTPDILSQGLAEPIISSSVDTTPFLRCALSLLSTNTWSSCEPKSDSLEQSVLTNHANMPQPAPHILSEGFPVSSTGFWRTEQESTDTQVQTLVSHSSSSNSYSQEIHLLGGLYDNDLYSNQPR